MKRSAFTLLAFIFLFHFQSKCQRAIEAGINPTELIFLYFQTHIGIGTPKTHYGLLLSFRPSTQDSGLVRSGGTGLAGGYGHRYLNRLYTSYTVGLYNKIYINKHLTTFLETNIFYRNWHFNHKPAEFNDVEKTRYTFKGVRTENIDVYCLKLLFGETFIFKTKREKKLKPYLDVYIGASIRYQEGTFETFNGYVGGMFYTYYKDRSYNCWPAPQVGMTLGFRNKKKDN